MPSLELIHEDADLLVFDKPSGLLCVPGRGADKADCLSARAQQRWPDALVVHRLDMATSGLVLMARNVAMQRALGDAFATQKVRKHYEAIVDGVLQDTGDWSTIDAPIAADWPRRPLRVVDASGKASMTQWKVLKLAGPGSTHLLLAPQTGRTHQLRVHLAHIGHAILGDTLYGNEAVQAAAPRLMLHATQLCLVHPTTQKSMQFDSPAPFDQPFTTRTGT